MVPWDLVCRRKHNGHPGLAGQGGLGGGAGLTVRENRKK